MNRASPRPGDLIHVVRSHWSALKDGEWLRVCEQPGWAKIGEEVFVAPRQQVRTFWGPDHGPPDGIKPEHMSTSGGPFRTVRIEEFEGLECGGSGIDFFWYWLDFPRADGGMERTVKVAIWRCQLLVDQHYRRCREFEIGGER